MLTLCLALTAPAQVSADEAQWAALDNEVIRLAPSGQTGAARETAEKAVSLAREHFGSDGRTANSLTLLAEFHMAVGAWCEAEPLLQEGKPIGELKPDPLDPMHEESLNLLGPVLMNTERRDDAERPSRPA